MFNLCSITKSQAAIRELARAMHVRTSNLPPPGIFPDYGAPIVREGEQGRELVVARWGMPSPVFAINLAERASTPHAPLPLLEGVPDRPDHAETVATVANARTF